MKKGGFGRTVALVTVALFIATALLPMAQASHLTLYHTRLADGSSVDQGIGFTTEDDGRVASQPGGKLDGMTNRVIHNLAGEIGDGQLFLDTQYYEGIPAGATSPYTTVFDNVFGPIEDGREMIRPGTQGAFFSWFGLWQDTSGEGRIDDYHDGVHVNQQQYPCPPLVPNCEAKDEFLWKGAGSGASTSMALYVIPTTLGMGNSGAGPATQRITTGCATTCFSAWHNGTVAQPNAEFDDRTELTEEQQGWYVGLGWDTFWTDESYLTSIQTITLADAARTNAPETIFDIKDPNAFIDVDRYESFNPAIESLWLSAAPAIYDAIVATRPANILAPVSEIVNGITRDGVPGALAIISGTISDATEQFEGYTAGVVNDVAAAQKDVNILTDPAYPREPNTWEDVFVGATFGGVGDVYGTGNSYALSQSDYHFFIDATTQVVVPMGANLVLSPLNTAVGVYGLAPVTTSEVGTDGTRGQSPGFLYADIDVALWFDENGDNWVGRVCDPSKDAEWDASKGECKHPFGQDMGNSNPQNFGHFKETLKLCSQTTLNGGGSASSLANGFKVTPVGTTWDAMSGGLGVTKIKWYDRPSYNIWPQNQGPHGMFTYHGSETIVLEIDGCGGTDSNVRVVDALLLPTGSLQGTIRTEVVASMTQVFRDASKGIEIAPESATDVDYLAGSL